MVVAWVMGATVAGAQHETDKLRRRADLGATIRPPAATAPARVVRISENSSLHAAGLRPGDEIVAVNGAAISDEIEFDRRMAALRGGDRVRLQVRREGRVTEIQAALAPMVREQFPATEVVYTHILTRPAGVSTRRPAILFVPWLSCDSVEAPNGASPGIEELLHTIAAGSGWVMLRVDKPGVGDSEGVCADTDLDTEIDGSHAALSWLRAHPWVDPAKVVIMGHSFSGAFLPLVAGTTPVAGYIVLNSWVRTWMERLLEFERLQAEASGLAASEVSERQRKLAEFYALFLEQQKTPRQVIAERPELASVWNDAPEHQYGRSARFHHQLQRINAARGWTDVAAATLVIWGESDQIMHRADHERLAALVNRNRAGAAEFVVIPGANHGLAAAGPDGRPQLPPAVPAAIRQFLDRVNASAHPAG
jgi:pimeloyl-ACP methyl ester carboxylesterase